MSDFSTTAGWAAFQRRRGLVADGKPGKKTLAEVEAIEADVSTQELPILGPRRLTSRDIERLAGVHVDILAVTHYAVRVCPHEFFVTRTGGKRDAAMQRRLFDKGASKKDGTEKISRHQTGHAVDVVSRINGRVNWGVKAAWDVHEAFLAAGKALGVSLRSGIDWDGDGDYRDETFLDSFHHELPASVYGHTLESKSPAAVQWLKKNGITPA